MDGKNLESRSKKLSFLFGALPVLGIAVSVTLAGFMFISGLTSVGSNQEEDPRITDWQHVHSVALDPANNDILYIATHGDFYQSIEGGSPQKVDKVRTDYMALTAPPDVGVPLYASGHPSTGGNAGLIKSTDGGITWDTVSKVTESVADFHAMAISKQNPEILIGYDGSSRTLFKTLDSGKNWKTLETPEFILSLAISPNDSEIVFAGTGNGIIKSTNGGQTWVNLEQYKGLLVYSLTFDNNQVLFASIDKFGLTRSDDLGNTWTDLPDIDLTVTSITTNSEDQELFISGYSSSGFQEVYKIPYDVSSYDLIATNKVLN